MLSIFQPIAKSMVCSENPTMCCVYFSFLCLMTQCLFVCKCARLMHNCISNSMRLQNQNRLTQFFFFSFSAVYCAFHWTEEGKKWWIGWNMAQSCGGGGLFLNGCLRIAGWWGPKCFKKGLLIPSLCCAVCFLPCFEHPGGQTWSSKSDKLYGTKNGIPKEK